MRRCFALVLPTLACNFVLGAEHAETTGGSEGETTAPTGGGDTTETGSSTEAESESDSETSPPPTCNMNGLCDPGESPALCPAECVNCGNGVPDPGEVCDEGAGNSDDGYFPGAAEDAPCNSSCSGKVPHCGDGICQSGNEDTSTCLADCDPICGNGLVDQDSEECDDGNDVNTDACLISCKAARCGDGVVEDGVESCDDANGSNSDDCLTACTLPGCGDGFVWAGNEDCDDGNDVETDDCDSQCAVVVHRKVFATSATYSGALGGLLGADSRCQSRAMAGALANPMAFKAWLSDAALSPSLRFDTGFTGVYDLTDEMHSRVAHGWTGLTSGGLEHAIDVDEFGALADGTAWTNTSVAGMPTSVTNHCTGWTLTGGSASVGDVSAVDNTWTEYPDTSGCLSKLRLYCFEDVAP